MTSLRRWAFPAFALFMLVLPLLPVPDFWVTQSNYIGLYALVSLGLVLLTGVAGLTSFGQAAFVGMGAYASAYLATAHAVSPWAGLRARFSRSSCTVPSSSATPPTAPSSFGTPGRSYGATQPKA